MALLLLVVAGCSGETGQEDVTEPDAVTYLTGFGASAHDSFIWVAQEKGYFAGAGIEVDIQLAGGTGNYHALLAG